ncbi:MAG: hypothetical protein LBP89_05950 [Helicobacteraceae bacterium]|jgi:hypothetical protein|nr:hypothetical protein [Helicobacteraceae bacterium]
MDAKFVAIVERLVKEQGKDTLINAEKCKGHLEDYVNNEFKKERHLLLIAIEVGAGKAIADASDLAICKKQQIRLLKDDHFIDETAAAKAVDLLALALRGDRSKSIASTPNVQPQSAPAYAPPPQIDDDKLTGEYITTKEPSIMVIAISFMLIGAIIKWADGAIVGALIGAILDLYALLIEISRL